MQQQQHFPATAKPPSLLRLPVTGTSGKETVEIDTLSLSLLLTRRSPRPPPIASRPPFSSPFFLTRKKPNQTTTKRRSSFSSLTLSLSLCSPSCAPLPPSSPQRRRRRSILLRVLSSSSFFSSCPLIIFLFVFTLAGTDLLVRNLPRRTPGRRHRQDPLVVGLRVRFAGGFLAGGLVGLVG